MENKIKELIEKYEDKSLEEPAYYFQWEEIIEDLKSLLKLYQAQNKEIPTIHNTIYRIGEK